MVHLLLEGKMTALAAVMEYFLKVFEVADCVEVEFAFRVAAKWRSLPQASE